MRRAALAISVVIVVMTVLLTVYGVGYYIGLGEGKSSVEPVVKSEPVPELPNKDELLKLVNEERAKVGVAPLVVDERLNRSAQQKADDLFTNKYFGHIDKNGRQGYDIAHEYAPDCFITSENLVWNKSNGSSLSVVYAWMFSEPHRKALQNPDYIYTGFGIAGDKVVEHFCQPR